MPACTAESQRTAIYLVPLRERRAITSLEVWIFGRSDKTHCGDQVVNARFSPTLDVFRLCRN